MYAFNYENEKKVIMKFVIISHVEHNFYEQKIYAYEPFVREMNLWGKFVDEILIVSPRISKPITSIETDYKNLNIKIDKIEAFNILKIKSIIKSFFIVPKVCFVIYKSMKWADHIHLRCPGNVGMLGCIVQILFPSKPKTIKYAGNWDPNSMQPLSYKIQKWILNNTFLTKNAKVLVYGNWQNQTKNIIPFFTASYSENDFNEKNGITMSLPSLKAVQNKHLIKESCAHSLKCDSRIESNSNEKELKFIYVGALSEGKQPLISIKVVHALKKKGFKVSLEIYGEGNEREYIINYIQNYSLENVVTLYGNASKKDVKEAYKKAHFLLFISKSEGWPKVVTEAMSWACLPITSNVSCTPFMLGYGKRGSIVKPNVEEIVTVVEEYISNEDKYNKQVKKAMEWSRQFTMEKFEEEIGKLLI